MLAPAPTSPPAGSATASALLRLARILVEAFVDDGPPFNGGAISRPSRSPAGVNELDAHTADQLAATPGQLVATVGPLAPDALPISTVPGGDPATGRSDVDPDDRPASGFDLLVRPLDGHPVDVLLGFTAPAEWTAIGTVTSAIAHHLGPEIDPGRPPPLTDDEPILFAYLVARDGASASVARRSDGTRWERSAATLVDAATGPVDDTLRRVLGLPTPSPTAEPVELWARLWLDRVRTEVGARPRAPWSWTAIALRHPAAELVVDDLDDLDHLDEPDDLPDPEDLADTEDSGDPAVDLAEAMPRLAEILAGSRTWDDLRLGYVSGEWSAPALPPDVAGWMDAGTFSRWLLAGVPSCPDSLAVLRELLPPRLVGRIGEVLRRWDLPLDVPTETGRPGDKPSPGGPPGESPPPPPTRKGKP